MRNLLICTALLAATAATVASSPSGGGPGDVIGSSNSVSVSLDADNPSSDHDATATLSVSQPIEAGSGEVRLNASFPPAPPAHITMSIASDTGEENETDVDTSSQSEVDIGITTWDGCSGECTENLIVSFDLDDTTLDGSVDFTFTLDGTASLAAVDTPDDGDGDGTGDGTGDAPSGSIAIDVQ